MTNTVCFYHRIDLDGMCSGAIVKKFLSNAKLIGVNHGEDFDFGEAKDKNVIMVDFSLQPIESMLEVCKISKTFFWIDHHKSAILEYQKNKDLFEEYNHKFTIVTDLEKAACELTWNYFVQNHSELVYLLGRYDVWDHQDVRVPIFQLGAKTYDLDPRTENGMQNWHLLFDECQNPSSKMIESIVEKGKQIKAYLDNNNKTSTEGLFHDVELAGYKFIAINKMGGFNVFKHVYNPQKYDAALTYFRLGNGKWSFGLYTDKPEIDVSIIAKSKGGGGHKGAAGFQCDELFF